MQELCGNSSVVERYLAKVNVAGSSLVSRSTAKAPLFGGAFFVLFPKRLAPEEPFAAGFFACRPRAELPYRPSFRPPHLFAISFLHTVPPPFFVRGGFPLPPLQSRRPKRPSEAGRKALPAPFVNRKNAPPRISPEFPPSPEKNIFGGNLRNVPRKRLQFGAIYGIVYRLSEV